GGGVGPNFFRVFRVQPAAGHLMDDARADGVREAVLSERFWRSRLGAAPSSFGRPPGRPLVWAILEPTESARRSSPSGSGEAGWAPTRLRSDGPSSWAASW